MSRRKFSAEGIGPIWSWLSLLTIPTMQRLQDDEMEALEAALLFVDDFRPFDHRGHLPTPPSTGFDSADRALDHELSHFLLETPSPDRDTVEHKPSEQTPAGSHKETSNLGNNNTKPRKKSGDQASGRKTKRRPQANPNKARDERKHELVYLRNKVKQMESELETLHHRRARGIKKEKTARSSGVLVAGHFNSEMTHVWRDIAARQEKRREKSERENARLKLVLESQVKLAKSMEKLFEKRARQQVAGCAAAMGSVDGSAQGSTLDLLGNKHTFDELLKSLDTAYAEMNSVFATNGLLGSEVPGRDARMREGPNGMYLDVFATKLLPFEYDAVATAVWNHFRGNAKHNGVVYENAVKPLEASSDTIMEVFTMELMGKEVNADFQVKQVVRRYVEAEQQVLIWVCHGHGLEQAGSPFSGFGFFEKAYVVTRRPTSLAQDFTILQMCSIMSPRMSAACSIDLTAADKFIDFVLSVVATNTTFNQELIESVLLEQELKKRQSPSTEVQRV